MAFFFIDLRDEVDLLTEPAHGFGNYSVQCFGCGLHTRQKSGKLDAINAWNYRAREIALVQDAVKEIERLQTLVKDATESA